jgi:hypothetical protein
MKNRVPPEPYLIILLILVFSYTDYYFRVPIGAKNNTFIGLR